MNTLEPGEYEELKREIVGMYNRAAPVYEQVGVKLATHFGRLLIDRLDIPAGAHALDIATGRGALLFPAAERVGPTGHVIGIDLAPNMIAFTTAEIKARGLTQAEVRLMDADDPSFPEHSFDYVLCGYALHFFDYTHALEKYRALLKPGATIATSSPYFLTNDAENMERWKWLFELTREVFPPGFTPPPSWTAPNRLNRPEKIEEALSQAGFVDVKTSTEEGLFHFRDHEEWWAWEWAQASRFWLEGMSPAGLARFKSAAFEKLKAMRTAEGIPIKQGALYAIAKAQGQ